MRGSVKPVINEVDSQKAEKPCPRRVPREGDEAMVFVYIHVQGQLGYHYQDPIKKRIYLSKNERMRK